MIKNSILQPDWPAPLYVKAYTTLRMGGISLSPFDDFNLADHVGDNIDHVRKNRLLLKQLLNLPGDPIWLKQTHSNIAVQAIPENYGKEADASFSNQYNQICAILTADCLPILLCDQKGTYIAAIHAGWRGLANGIIKEVINKCPVPSQELLAWLGPAIGPQTFEVGEEVYQLFLELNPVNAEAFKPSPKGRWLANIYTLAKIQLEELKISQIYGGNFCTYSNPLQFYSYRRDGEKTGRMATLIWLTDSRIED